MGNGQRVASVVVEVLRSRREQLAQRWAEEALFRTVYLDGRESAVQAARALVDALTEVAAEGGSGDPQAAGFDRVRPVLSEILGARSAAGASIGQIQAEAGRLRPAAVALVRDSLTGSDDHGDVEAFVEVTELIGTLRLVLTEAALLRDSGIIARQRQELLEIATPVLTVWPGVLAVPVIGTLDSARSQVMMEALLEGIVEQRAAVAILDITGVPMVDTVVAQHLMNTAAAVRLMGATCVISGIRPQIAQTIAALGIDLGEIRTRASLADALAWALTYLRTEQDGVRNSA